MSSRLDAEQIFCVEAGRIAAAGTLATKDDLARLSRAMEAARPYMNDEIRTQIYDHCAEICREGPSAARALRLLEMLHERIVHLTNQRGPWYVREGLTG